MNGEFLLVALMTILPTDNDRLDHTQTGEERKREKKSGCRGLRVVHQICVTTHSDREVMALSDDTNQKKKKKKKN
ncbi:Uncharacterized protein APZ42_021571 [Daphnia magna]|uniref:Uncharacterized protein n=1 Tax=Daphnia magna TaxID=35525 RepID=A0A164WJZ5_9CRUS|nr:Uncharacterized protein APZ42_021571 [Daphnia magna]